MPTPLVNKASYLTLNSMPCATPAWWIKNLEDEILKAPALKGGDLDLPASTGALGFPRRIAATVYQFDMTFVGYYGSDGAAQAWRAGIVTNIREFKAGIGIASASGDGTVTATYTTFGGGTTSAAVHVVRFETQSPNKTSIDAVLEISAPLGVFA